MPSSAAGIGPVTVITWPRADMAGGELAHACVLRRTPRRAKTRVLSQIAARMISAGDDLGEERRDVGQDQAVADHGDGERAEHRAEDGAAAAEQGGAAQHDGGDHLELEADGGVGGARAEAGGDDDAGDRRAMPVST